jgi:geranylgeranyl pyrophosphate synthase
MYSKKTGKLFEFSFSAPFILKDKSKIDIQFAKDYGMLFGLIFQVIDDLIDEIGSFKKIGKTPGKDVEQGKSTLLQLIGEKQVTDLCNNKINTFIKKYNDKLNQNPILIKMLEFGMDRVN